MSEKIVLTQEQAKLIEELKGVAYAVNLLDMGNKYPLSELKVSELVRAFNGHYEVEKPKFKTGDKVVTVWEKDNSFYILGAPYPEISDFEKGKGWHLVNQPFGIQEKNIRHATPEEIYWLHELGREKVRDFKVGDVFVDRLNAGYRIYSEQNMGQFIQYYEEDDFIGIYPAESFCRFPGFKGDRENG